MARLISASLQSPMPALLLEVMLRAVETPHGPGNSRPPLPTEFLKIGTGSGRPERRVTFHAMRDGDEIESLLELVAEIGLGHGLLGPGKHLVGHRLLVDRAGYRMAHGRQGAQICDDAVEIARGENLLEPAWHDRRHVVARGARTPLEPRLDLGIAPIADSGLTVRGNVGGRDIERGLVEMQSAGQRAVELRPIRPHRRMAVVTGHDGIDQIAPALERSLPRPRRRRCKRYENAENHATIHRLPPSFAPPAPITRALAIKKGSASAALTSFLWHCDHAGAAASGCGSAFACVRARVLSFR